MANQSNVTVTRTGPAAAQKQEKGATSANDLLSKHGFKIGNKAFTPQDVANEAMAVQEHTDELETVRGSFAKHFIAMAKTCSTDKQFLTVCAAVEAANSWKSVLNPQGEKKAPGVWNQTKSNVKVGWEKHDLKPGKDYDTAQKLNELLQAAREAAKAKESNDDASETTDKAVQEAAKENQAFANLLHRIAKLYGEQTDDGKARMIESLAELYNQYNDTDKETKELMADLTGAEGVEVQQAASH
jgi:hypothetical protein